VPMNKKGRLYLPPGKRFLGGDTQNNVCF
jgi:hypothetical protein